MALVGGRLVHINSYQDQTTQPRAAPPAPPVTVLRRVSDFVMMVVVGLVTVVLLLGSFASSVQMAGSKMPAAASEHLWALTGAGGFLLGLSWRFIFWDLPGMLGHLWRYHRGNLPYLVVAAVGIAVLVLM